MILLAPVGELVLGDVPALRMVLTAKFQGYYELLQLSWFPRKICAQVDKFLNSYRSALMRAIPVLWLQRLWQSSSCLQKCYIYQCTLNLLLAEDGAPVDSMHFNRAKCKSCIGYFIPPKVPFFNTQTWALLPESAKSAQIWAFKNGTFGGMK